MAIYLQFGKKFAIEIYVQLTKKIAIEISLQFFKTNCNVDSSPASTTEIFTLIFERVLKFSAQMIIIMRYRPR